jgi:hydrogenase maturation protease
VTGRDDQFWDRMQTRGPATVVAEGTPMTRGSRVRLRPRSRADIVDMALDGQVAVVESVEQSEDGSFQLAVTLADDPGRDLGEARMPGHRFFFAVEEVEPLPPDLDTPAGPRVLVAGIGNVFLGDDGFGVEVVRRMSGRPTPPGVDVVEFGIRGMDLVYALQRDYQAVLFVDAAVRGEPPGTLTVLEPQQAWHGPADVRTHGMDPVQVLRLARELGQVPDRVLVLCIEPDEVMQGGPDEDVVVELSEPVRGALDEAVRLVEETVDGLLRRARREADRREQGRRHE